MRFAGKYKIERMIARGGMSGVYLASQLPLHRPVALKILVPLMQDPEGEASFEERFRLEARTLASLNHPNIVHLYDYGETEDGRFYLAMELVDGPRLSDVLKEAGNMDVQRALRVVLHTCAALRYAHNRGVIHRDIKLSNIMLWRYSDGVSPRLSIANAVWRRNEQDSSEIPQAGVRVAQIRALMMRKPATQVPNIMPRLVSTKTSRMREMRSRSLRTGFHTRSPAASVPE